MRIYGPDEPGQTGRLVPPAPDLNDEPMGLVSMMNHGKHSYLMVAIVAVGAVLFLTGNAGGLLFLLWPLACMAMMVWMMWGMGGMGRGAADPVDHTHDHIHDAGLAHTHK